MGHEYTGKDIKNKIKTTVREAQAQYHGFQNHMLNQCAESRLDYKFIIHLFNSKIVALMTYISYKNS